MKKNKLLILISFLFVLTLKAQNSATNNLSSIEINLGRGIHGTGDMPGFHFGFTFTDAISKNFHWFVGLEGTLHDDEGDVLIYEDPDGNTVNGTLYDVNGGMQLVGGLRYNFIQNTNHNFGASLGAIFRYQASSINDVVATFYPVITELPVPVRIIINESKSRTYSLGGAFKLHYNYKISNKYFIGLSPGFQTDTNGDTITFATLGFGIML